jgi:hypothetical protein
VFDVAEPDTSVTGVPKLVPSIANCTVPVGELPVTVAVKLTDWPYADGFELEVTAVVVCDVSVSSSVVVSVKLPDVPVTVTVNVPVVAVPVAVSVNVLVLVAGFGLKAAVTPFGKPEADNVTFPLNPFTGMMVIVLVP